MRYYKGLGCLVIRLTSSYRFKLNKLPQHVFKYFANTSSKSIKKVFSLFTKVFLDVVDVVVYGKLARGLVLSTSFGPSPSPR